LTLREEKTLRVMSDSNVEEMMKNTKIRHRKFRAKKSDNMMKKSRCGGCKYDIINIK
jgi:hypothetical protein